MVKRVSETDHVLMVSKIAMTLPCTNGMGQSWVLLTLRLRIGFSA